MYALMTVNNIFYNERKQWLFACISTELIGFWKTLNCGQEHKFICKRPGSSPVNTTAAPTPPPKGGCPLSWTKFDTKVRYRQ